MEGVYLERKCYYIGHWKDDTVADTIIRQVAQKVRNGSGTKCKLHLSNDGIRITTSSLMTGSHLKDVVPFSDIFFTCVNQYNPNCLLFITKDERRRYRILAFRCKSDTDVAFFVSCFKDLRTARNGKGNQVELKQNTGGNWTLRAKHTVTDKRQLNNIMNIKNPKQNGDVKQNGIYKQKRTEIKANGNVNITMEPPVSERKPDDSLNNNNTARVVRKDSDDIRVETTIVTSEHVNGEDVNMNSMSESGLRDELDQLSHELREIKFLLETSAGVGPEFSHTKNGNNVVTNGDAKIDAEVIDTEPEAPITAVVIEDKNNDSSDDDEVDNKENGKVDTLNLSKNTQSTTSSEGEIKVSVPDYRTSGQQTGVKYERRYVTKESSATVTNGDLNSPREDLNSPRYSTTSYDTWKDDVVLRKSVTPRSARSRSAYVSTSSYDSSVHGSFRERNPHVVYMTTNRAHNTLPHHSLRVPMRRSVNRSSTIERPIEKVYPRPKSTHGSIVYRPSSSGYRTALYAVPTTSKKVYVDGKYQNKGEITRLQTPRRDDAVIIKT